MKKIFLILLACYGFALDAQTLKRRYSGLDSVIIGCGANPDRMYNMQSIYDTYPSTLSGMVPQSSFPTGLIQTCGSFRVYFVDLLNTPAVGFADPTVVGSSTKGQLRINTYCAVLNYIQTVIHIPTGVTIDVYVDASFDPTSNPAPTSTNFIAHAGPYFQTGQLGTSGFFAGNVYNHITTGTDPDANNYDAYVQVNFDKVYDPSNIYSYVVMSFWDDYTNTTQSCQFDLYSVLLHEMTHALGWFSNVVEDGTTNQNPVCYYSGNSFSRFDNLFLYFNSNIDAPSGTYTKIVDNSLIAINSAMSSFSLPLRKNSVWLYNSGTPINQPVYSGDQINYPPISSSAPTNKSYMSHMNDNFGSFTSNAQYSPGYQPNYLMSPAITQEMLKREWTLPELRVLSQFGYTFNYPFSSSYSNSGTVTSSVISNTPAFRNNYNKITEFMQAGQTYTGTYSTDFPESAMVADFTVTTNNNTPSSPTATQLVINLSSDATLHDNEGNPISVIPSSLFNIRGCGSGGNNHNCLVLSNSNKTITYTPRPGFSGRAQFGFYLTDGIERGALKIYTIDVQNINSTYLSTLTTMGSNFVMNGSFEEGVEDRLRNINESIENTGLDFYREGQYCSGYHMSDNHPYIDLSQLTTYAQGPYIENSWKVCGQNNLGLLGNYGADFSDFNPEGYYRIIAGNSANPIASTSTSPNNRYSRFATIYSQLLTSPQTCHRYRFEADVSFQKSGFTVGQAYTFTVSFTSVPQNAFSTLSGTPTVTVNQQIPITVTVTTTSVNAWQHVSYDFNYCGNPSPYMRVAGGSYPFVDNLSLIEVATIPFTLSVTNSTPSICTGASSQLTAVPVNPFCTPTYTWAPAGSLNSSSASVVTATPTTTTIYTLTANDGCSTATATTTETVSSLPAPSLTISPTTATVCASHPITLTASGASTYTWSTSATTASISVSPTVTSTYTLTATSSNGCTNSTTKTVTVTPNPTVTVAASSTVVCSGQSSTLTASGASTYTWSPSSTLSSSTGSTVTATPTATTIYTVTGTNSGGCTNANTVTVTLSAPTFTPTAIASPSVICVNQTSTLTASGGSTYTWSPSGSLSSSTGSTVTATPTATTIYTVSSSNGGCAGTGTVSLNVSSCTVCAACTNPLTGTITTDVPINSSYCINNNITFSGTVSCYNSEFKIAPGVVITIAPNSSISIEQCHFYSCTGDMWQGFVVPSTATLSILSSSLIEDAKVAVTTTTTTQNQMANLTFSESVFNKNNISLQVVSTNTINPPSGNTYPIKINTSCIFTGRTINTSGSTMPNWPNITVIHTPSVMPSPLQSPYLNQYSVTTCKDGTYPLHAIELTNVGTTTWNPSSPPATYDEVYIGGNSVNIFDNHYYDIYANNANVTVVSSVFQNAQYAPGNHTTPAKKGEAVYAYSTDNAGDNYRLQLIPVTGTVSANSFYNLYTIVDMYHYLETNIKYNNCYSTMATYTVSPPSGVWQGETGFTLMTNRYYNLTVDHNNIYNISNSILFTADAGNYTNLSGGVSSGRYGGQVNITNNLIRPHLLGTTPTTQFVNQGINVSDIVSLGSYTNTTVSGTNINISNNIIAKVWNGIYASGFGLQPVSTYSNYITLVKAQNGLSSPTQQYGISHNSVTSNTISVNYVDASAINVSEQSRNITTALNGTISITCNTETGGWRGIEFNGTQTVGSVGNQFSNNTYGMVLDNSGVIGVQGTSTNPRWLQWTGTWGSGTSSPPFKTYTASSASSATNSILWVKSSPAVYTPDGNGGTGGFVGTDNYYNSGFTGTIRYSSSPASWSCSTTVPTCTNCRGAQPVMTTEDSVNAFNAMQLMEKVAANAIQYDAADSAINRYISKMTIYRRLRADTNAFFGSNKLRAFYKRMQNSSMEKLFQTEDAFVNGDFTTAQNSIASVNPSNRIEQNHLSYYGILINQKKNTMTSVDSSNLWALANACPFKDGAIVYQARALYNAINSPGIIFRDNCQKTNATDRLENISTTSVITGFDAYVYPNPNLGKEVFINTLGLNEGTVVIKLMDLEGRTVIENNCTVANGLSNFKINDIKNGVYFVHITNTGTGEHIVKKIVIQY